MSVKLFIADIDGTLTDGGYYASAGALVSDPEVKCNPLQQFESVAKKFHTRDFHGLYMLHRSGVKVAFATLSRTKANKVHLKRSAPFGTVLECLDVSGSNEVNGCKVRAVKKAYVDTNWCKWEEMAFIGDDLPDLELLQKVGLPSCPHDAVFGVQDFVRSQEEGIVCLSKGGDACVREFVDHIFELGLV
jgi:3-deoxy-D-manno-octulosonate 8-phosphate phosphatase KdsC-like HAD superfamily phosphatase